MHVLPDVPSLIYILLSSPAHDRVVQDIAMREFLRLGSVLDLLLSRYDVFLAWGEILVKVKQLLAKLIHERLDCAPFQFDLQGSVNRHF